MIPTVQAAVFHKFMGTGRTTPALCACEDADGNTVGDFVVKLRGGTERGTTGMVSELVGSLLAAYFGIPVPPPSLVHIEAAFADLVGQRHPDKSQRMSGSVGLNFGSRQLNDVVTWPIDKSVPDAMWATATSIFAFDALIENPDRKFSPNPNLFSQGDQIFVFDHELAFSFIEVLFPSPTPWKLERSNYLADHVYFKRLKGKDIDLTLFTARLDALAETALPEILAQVPEEWNNGSLSKINAHLCAMAPKAAQFAEEVRRRLA